MIGKGSWAYEVEEISLLEYCGRHPLVARCLCIGKVHLTVIKAQRPKKLLRPGYLVWRGLFDGWAQVKLVSPVGTGISGPAGKENTFVGPTVSETKMLVWGSPSVVKGTPMVSCKG